MTEKVDKPLKESLSALVDGEASELELRRVLKTGADHELRSVWQRYQLVGDLMRRDCHSPLEARQASAFSSNVLAAIEAGDSGEPSSMSRAENSADSASAQAGARSSAARNWFAGVGKAAIAASVTLALLLGVNQISIDDSQGLRAAGELASTPEDPPGDTSAVVPDGYSIPSLSAMTVSSVAGTPSRYRNPVRSLTLPASSSQAAAAENNAELQARLQRMLMLHSDKASEEVGLTIVPSSRLSSQDTPRE